MGQKHIASFFAGGPSSAQKAGGPHVSKASPGALRDASNAGSKKRGREESAIAAGTEAAVPAAARAPEAAAKPAAKPGLRRLRKGSAAAAAVDTPAAPPAQEGSPAASPKPSAAPSPATRAAALEDDDCIAEKGTELPAAEPAPKPAAGRAKKKAKKPAAEPGRGAAPGKKAAAGKKATTAAAEEQVAAALEGSAGSAEEDDAGSPAGNEVEDRLSPGKEAKPSKKPVLPPSIKADGSIAGVGPGAQAAAAEHGTFDLDKLATWQQGQPVPFAFLANTFEAIAEQSGRLVITNLLVNAFRAILATTPDDLLPSVYLCTNKVGPSHEGAELGVGDATLIKALAEACGRQVSWIKKEYEESGDLGSVAAVARSKQTMLFKPKPLAIGAVFRTFQEIARTQGSKSQDRKRALIIKLLASSKENEAGYMMRALQGKLRIGLAEQTVLVALAHAVLLQLPQPDPPADAGTPSKAAGKAGGLAAQLDQAAQVVKYVYSQCPSYDQLVPALLKHPIWELKRHVSFVVGVPVKPMLAKPTTGVSEVLDKFQDTEFTCEYKYDGERAQIHITQDRRVFIYSRNSENMTTKYPDLARSVPALLQAGTAEVVLDCECVAYDREQKKMQPFQVLSTRKRKDVEERDIKVQVCLYAFDCLYLNGRVLVDQPLTERRAALYGAIREQEGELCFAVAKVSRELDELSTFLNDAVAFGTEGLIVKTMDSTYEPSKRSAHWLKLKKDYLEGVGDTFDLVPIGAWHGRGKRAGVYGAYLLAIYNEEAEAYQTISKIGTGFSEERLRELTEQLKPHAGPAPKPYYRYGETLVPDVWFEPRVVWEVKAADLSISPVHKAALGMVDPAKGISIRFPRLVRVRDDKAPEQATGAEQVVEMYQAQSLSSKKKAAAADDDD